MAELLEFLVLEEDDWSHLSDDAFQVVDLGEGRGVEEEDKHVHKDLEDFSVVA